jgi:lipid II:glycine glycyltransferase (peptidoglycan interpeptide bridge formation enzyme)
MTMRFAENTETDNWNDRILANPDGGNIFQGKEFADQKILTGWKPHFIIANDTAITVHEKSVPSLGKLWYLPKGPGIKTPAQLSKLLPELKEFASKHDVFAIKIEPELEKTDATVEALKSQGLRHVTPIQPNFSTVLIDLAPNLETVMKNFNQKGRHAINRAKRDGVTIERVESNDRNCKLFYDLLATTAAGSFVIRPYDYYFQFWHRYAKAGQGQLFFTYFQGDLVAGGYALMFGRKSTYKDGASVRNRTAYGASHLLQWEIMTWAKERGSLVHDLCGTPPSDKINDESHPWYGVGRFKTSFNKQVTDYVGTYDLVVKPRPYALWTKFGERAAKSLWWRTHHESWY